MARCSGGTLPPQAIHTTEVRGVVRGNLLSQQLCLRFIPLPVDLVFVSGGSVSFFARVGFAHVFAIFCFAVKPGPLLVINVRVRAKPHHSRPSAGAGVALVVAAAGAGLAAGAVFAFL